MSHITMYDCPGCWGLLLLLRYNIINIKINQHMWQIWGRATSVSQCSISSIPEVLCLQHHIKQWMISVRRIYFGYIQLLLAAWRSQISKEKTVYVCVQFLLHEALNLDPASFPLFFVCIFVECHYSQGLCFWALCQRFIGATEFHHRKKQ